MTRKYDRQRFIRVAVVSGAAFAGIDNLFSPHASFADSEIPDGALGIVVSTGKSGLTLATDGGDLLVVPAAGARMYTGAFGIAQDVSDFIVGDRVVVQGSRTGSDFTAVSVGSLLRRQFDSTYSDGRHARRVMR